MKIFRLLFLLLGCSLWAQSDKITDSILQESTSLVYSDIGKAEKHAQFLVQNQTRSENAVLALLVLADAAYLKADFETTIKHLYDAEKRTVGNASDAAILRELYFTHYYRLFGFTELAQQYQSKALYQLQQFSKNDVLHSELWARYYLEASESVTNKHRVTHLLQAQQSLNQLKNTGNKALQYQIEIALASAYAQNNRHADALNLLQPIANEAQHNVLQARALLEMAMVQKAVGKPYSQNLFEAYRLLEIGTDLPAQRAICKALADDFLKTDNISAYKKYLGEYINLDNQITHNTKVARNSVIKNLEQAKSQKTHSNLYYFFAVAALSVLLLYGIYTYVKTKQDYKKFLKVVEKVSVSEIIPAKQMAIPQKTEQALLEKLSKFEKSNRFTNASLTINTLAKSLDTNTKYLSEVINRNKNANFNQYLNELRINFIIAKMKEDPKYLNYKIYYLAKECGFSSQSTFSTVFRASTGISPMSFIKFLKNEKIPV